MTAAEDEKQLLNSGFILYVKENTEESKRLKERLDIANTTLQHLHFMVIVQNIILGSMFLAFLILLIWKWEYILHAISILFNTIGERL